MTEDEAKAVAEFAALCVWDSMDHWRPIMRYGRLFTPGTTAGGPDPDPDRLAANAYRLAMDKGLLYAEGYVRFSPGFAGYCAWCLDGETVVSPGFRVPVTAYFGVALRPDYVRRVYEARQRYRAGDAGFRWVFQPRHEVINPPLDVAADIVGDLGRGIPALVREWALTTSHPSGSLPEAEAWLQQELLGSADAGAVPTPPSHAGTRTPDTDAALSDHDAQRSGAPLPRPYARYLIRRVDGSGSGMALVYNGPGADGYSDNAVILGEPVQDGDTLDTLIRMADEHGLECEWAAGPGGELDEPAGLAAHRPAEVHLKWVDGSRAGDSFAVLHRLDYNVWDAWRQPNRPAGQATAEEPPERLTRNGDSYEMALAAVFRAMGDAMPEDFTVVCPPFELPAGQSTPLNAPLPTSYARHQLIHMEMSTLPSGMSLFCSGQTGGRHSWQTGGPFTEVEDGDSLDTLIRMADEHRHQCGWELCPASERDHPERTVEGRAEVHLKWVNELHGENFAVLHHRDYDVWDAWRSPRPERGQTAEDAAVRLTRKDVNYELALMSVFRAMGTEMPEEFTVVYL